jgi:16S rRNA (adenine1518-N6/adenine1519-N6)-dimethyltransferase
LSQAGSVTAVEYDEALAAKLPAQFPGKNLTVVQSDILSFDLNVMPTDYKVVGNIPYYITNKIVRALTDTPHRPTVAVLLVQKEVAERLAARAGDMSILSIAAQVYYDVTLGAEAPAKFFTPPPKVDSQAVVLTRRSAPLINEADIATFFRIVRAGFSERRKKLRSSLAGGLSISKAEVEQMLVAAGIDQGARAQELSIEDWRRIMEVRS